MGACVDAKAGKTGMLNVGIAVDGGRDCAKGSQAIGTCDGARCYTCAGQAGFAGSALAPFGGGGGSSRADALETNVERLRLTMRAKLGWRWCQTN